MLFAVKSATGLICYWTVRPTPAAAVEAAFARGTGETPSEYAARMERCREAEGWQTVKVDLVEVPKRN